MQLDPVGAHESDEKRVEGERQTPVNVVHKANSLEACRGRGSFVPGEPPSLLVLGAEKTRAFKAVECRRRAPTFRPFCGARFAHLVLLAGGPTLSGGPLPHGCESEGEVR